MADVAKRRNRSRTGEAEIEWMDKAEKADGGVGVGALDELMSGYRGQLLKSRSHAALDERKTAFFEVLSIL